MHLRHIFHIFLYICLSLTLLNSMAHADSSSASTELTSIQIGVGEWPPFLSESLPEQGIVAQLIRDVFQEAGYRVELVFLPWVRAYEYAARAEFAATAVWMFKDERTEEFIYSDPVLSEQFVLFHKDDTEFEWETIADLKGTTIGGGIGYSYGAEFDEATEKGVFDLLRQPSVAQNLRMLAAGRIDLFVEEISVANYTLKNDAPELEGTISYHPKPVLENKSFVLFPKSSPNSASLIEAFNRELEAFRQDGRYESYFE